MGIKSNQYGVIKNPHQGDYRKVLTVCSAGCLRSPTAAVVLSQAPYNFNTRSAGIYDGMAITPVTETLLYWADEIVCMEKEHAEDIEYRLKQAGIERKIKTLQIEDRYEYRNPVLMKLIAEKYDAVE